MIRCQVHLSPSCALINIIIARRQKKPSLFGALCKSLKWQLLAPIPGRLCLVAFTFGQPLLLNRFVTYLQEPESVHSANYGYGLILAYAVVYLGMAVSLQPPFLGDVPDVIDRSPPDSIGTEYIDRLP